MTSRKRFSHTHIPVALSVCLAASLALFVRVPAPGIVHAQGLSLHPASIATRRAAALQDSIHYATALQSAWNSIAGTPSLHSASLSAYAYDLTTHRPLAGIHPDWRLTPASIMKLFTSVAGLKALGPSFRYRTTVELAGTSGAPPTIYLVGGGDPWLEANGALNLESMARKVASRVHAADRVVGVPGVFGPPATGTGWTWDDLEWNYTPVISGLTSERDQLDLLVQPSAIGKPPRYTINPLNPSIAPGSPILTVINDGVTVAGNAHETLSVNREPGSNIVMIRGNIPLGARSDNFFSLENPALLTATLFQSLLTRDGVHFSESAGTGTVSGPATTLLIHASPPLANYLQIQNTYSINLMAENLFRMIGLTVSHDGSGTGSAAAVATELQTAGIPGSYTQVDGSGLSPLDEVSARQMVSLLTYAYGQPWFTTFEHSLIHIGRTNQCSFMCGLMDYTPADGTVWLKTGNLGNQWNYAGYARAKNGDLIAFAILADGLRANGFFQQASGPEDQMTEAVAAWPHENPAGAKPTAATPPLPANIASLLPPGLDTGDIVSVSIVRAQTGQTVYSMHGGTLLEPALLPRLETVFAFLKARPASPWLSTSAETTGRIVHGVLQGPLVVVGRGNSWLTGAQALSLARQIKNSGVRTVKGPLEYVTDNMHPFTAPSLPASLPWEDFGQGFATPGANLTINGGDVRLSLSRSTGSTAVSTHPSSPPLGLELKPSAAPSPNVPAVKWIPGTNLFEIADPSINKGANFSSPTATVTIGPLNPDAVSATAFLHDLRLVGVQVDGSAEPIPAVPKQGKIVGSIGGPDMAQVVSGTLGTPAAQPSLSLYHILHKLSPRNPLPNLAPVDEMPDPSGLGLENYMTATSVSRLLAKAWSQPSERPLTAYLADRAWITTAPEQWALSGYVTGGRSGAYAVTLIVNGLPWNGRFEPTENLPNLRVHAPF